MSALQSSSLPASQPASQPATLSIYLHSILIQWRRKADLLVRGSASIHYLMGERLQTLRPATEVSDTLHWPGQRRAAWPNTNMLSHLLHCAGAAPNPPCPWPCFSLSNHHPSSLLWYSESSRWENLSLSWSLCCWSSPVAMAGPGNRKDGGGGGRGGGRSSFIDMQQTAVAEQRPLSTYWESRPADRVVD